MKINKTINLLNEKLVNRYIAKKIPKQVTINKKITSLPIVAIPLVAYSSLKGIRDANNTKNCREAIEKQKKLLNENKITQNEYNQREQKIKQYYDNADKQHSSVSSSKIKQNEPTFKGEDYQNTTETGIDSDKHFDINTEDEIGFKYKENGDIDVESIDINMDPELEAIYNAPPIETPRGLVQTIFGGLPSDVDVDMDIWDTLKSIAKDIVNPEEWF